MTYIRKLTTNQLIKLMAFLGLFIKLFTNVAADGDDYGYD